MDEFGVLVESIGFRAHGKSAPIAKLKPKPKSHFTNNTTINASSFNDSSSLPVDELDGVFRSNFNINGNRQSQSFFGGDDIFGGSVSSSNQFGGVDLESVLNSSNNRKNGSNLNSRNYVGSNAHDDFFGLNSKPSDAVDDLFGNFGVSSNVKQEKKGAALDDLIPGFGGARPSKNKVFLETNLPPDSNGRSSNSSSAVIDDPFLGSSNSSSDAIDDPFLVFESSVSQSDASWPFAGPSEQDIGKHSVQSSISDFDDFVMGGVRSGAKVDGKRTTANKPNSGTASNGFENANDLDAIFGGDSGVRQNARPSSVDKDSLFGEFFGKEKQTKVKQSSSKSTFSTNTASSAANVGDDFTSLFGDVTTSSGEFHEIDEEPEERRRARLINFIKKKERMAEAVAQMNQRDLQIQREQEEKRRLAETLDNDIKRWAAGKEGNLRALLSSLQQILWPECGWPPVSLTDMITSESVKKVYMKSYLYVHPDKVQQKGANLQQKYLAEKVFDILKEAWNKFRAEELQ
ncbi:hypothetical protein BUALT_Bualt01G0012900 [Buddleja alternifolia]|uniref:Auxilin-related protein 1 n=1 Tax=Buddleja alternifolia TaxID=168488 RepID=A0AAV6YE59_9LAMI|nr:hypothetical protein BUALT_Bualt01G0012900 [Buddleja alternifolia]